MNPDDLLRMVEEAESNGHTEVALKIKRRCKGETVRIMPGVTGRLVQWGDGTWSFPSVAFVSVADLRAGLAKIGIGR